MELTPERVVHGLKWRAEAAYDRLPRPIRVWLENRRLNARVRTGWTSYDRSRLMHTYREALRLLRDRAPRAPVGDYLEFGVYHGGSLSCMYHVREELGLSARMRLFGFDSFEGLPESAAWEDDGEWAPGQFCSSLDLTRDNLRRWGVPDDQVTLIRGWFNESCTPATKARYGLEQASVVMVDCDLYSSTQDVLRFAAPLVRSQAVFVFDDWDSGGLADKRLGEARAFEEFLESHPEYTAEELPGLNYKSKPGPRVFLLARALGALTAWLVSVVGVELLDVAGALGTLA